MISGTKFAGFIKFTDGQLRLVNSVNFGDAVNMRSHMKMITYLFLE